MGTSKTNLIKDIISSRKRAALYLRVSTDKQVQKEIDPHGLSIPDQNEACTSKADQLDADVVAVFVELAETAKVLDRPELQRLLNDEELLDSIDYLIVFNLSRLARDVGDQIEIIRFLRNRGVQLISVTEHIDDTPAGKLHTNMLGSFNQYHSDNSGYGAIRGMTRKAKVGGTPGRAPIGYLNITRNIEGRPVKLVEVDPERADTVRWTFEAYATGEWTIRQLAEELADRGFTAAPSGDKPRRPMQPSRIAHMLGNPYYIGIVTFRGVQYEGRHEKLIDPELFERVQTILASRRHASEKQRVHRHYLKGTIFCLTCGARLCVMHTINRHGTHYPYFFCLGRQRKNGCRQPYLSMAAVEAKIEDHYRSVSLAPGVAEAARKALADELAHRRSDSQAEVKRQQKRLTRLADEQRKLLQAHYADAVPLDLLKEEQDRIRRERLAAETRLKRAQQTFGDVAATITQALELAANLHEAYRQGDGTVRRLLNQFFFAKVLVGPDDVQVELSEPVAALYTYARGQQGRTSEQNSKEAPYLRYSAPQTFSFSNGPGWSEAVLVPLTILQPAAATHTFDG